MEKRTTAIYGLLNPATGELRYVGRSVQPATRLKQHIGSVRWEKYQRIHLTRWIAQLLDQGLTPEMIILEEGPGEFWREAEAFWIAYFKSLGCDMVNAAPGGVGMGEASPELRRARSEAARVTNGRRSYDELRRDWVAISPEGERFEFTGLPDFCRKRGLDTTCMNRVAHGTRRQHKGWKCWRKDTGPVPFKGVGPTNLRHAKGT